MSTECWVWKQWGKSRPETSYGWMKVIESTPKGVLLGVNFPGNDNFPYTFYVFPFVFWSVLPIFHQFCSKFCRFCAKFCRYLWNITDLFVHFWDICQYKGYLLHNFTTPWKNNRVLGSATSRLFLHQHVSSSFKSSLYNTHSLLLESYNPPYQAKLVFYLLKTSAEFTFIFSQIYFQIDNKNSNQHDWKGKSKSC